ncbi:M23 family metallopeptidase [Candidatus Azambacteria bacterium]|nr:M23 family metallopeptidase [Candidatus Azambacteria bacterium]
MKNTFIKTNINVQTSVIGVLTLIAVSVLFFAFQTATAEAQVKYRLPLSSNPGINAWFDHDSGSGFKRYDCSTSGGYNGHEGTDFSTYLGRPIYAGAHGSLYYRYDNCANSGSSGCGGGFGNHVRIEHTDSKVTIYAHMKSGTPAWYQSLLCSAQVGEVASSGDSSGNHLHFEIWNSTSGSYSTDPFSGSCSQVTSYWVNQNNGSPTTQCQ